MIAAVLSFSNLWALRTGDMAKDVSSRWKDLKHFQVKYNTVDKRNSDKLKVLIFCYPTNEDFKTLLPLIDTIDKQEHVKMAFVANNDSEVVLFLTQNPEFKHPITADKKAVTEYMAGSLLYPKAFVIDYKNQIIWDGELIDVLDMVTRYKKGTFNEANAVAISKQLDQIQIAMRNGDDFKAERAVAEILKLEPVNMPALRMRIFMLENTNRQAQAYELLNKQKSLYPDEPQLYLLMLDLASRYNDLSINAAQLGEEFAKRKLGTLNEQILFSWILLNSFNFNYEAIMSSKLLLENAKNNLASGTKLEQALYNSTSALLAYRTGKIAQALEFQTQASQLFASPENKQMLDFYSKLNQ